MSTEGSRKAVIAAMSANLAIAMLKFLAWSVSGASSMLAEAIHSLADTSNQLLLLQGNRRATKQATDEHPFGYGRERFISGFLVAVILFSLGGLFALYEALHKFEDWQHGKPDPLLASSWWWVPLVVLAASIVGEAMSFRTAVRESSPSKGRQNWLAFIRTAKSPELPVILLEDFAALTGLTFALLGVGLSLLLHNGIFDVFGTALIGVLLVVVAIVLALETRSLLLGESANVEVVQRIRQALLDTDGVDGVIHMKTLHLGPEEILVAAKIAVRASESALRVAQAIDAAEANVRRAEPMVTAMYLEPDILRADYRPAERPPRPSAPSH